MLASLIVCVLVGVLTFYQVFKQGAFSALIMAVLSIVSAVLALNYYAVLSPYLYKWGVGGFGPNGICLMVIFAFCLLVLRLIADSVVSGNMNLALPIDRAGAAIFGFISSLIVVGIIALGFQLLPVSTGIVGFNRCPELNDPSEDRSLFPNADGFVVGLMATASKYCFAGKNKFAHYHPDFLRELYCGRLALDPASRREAAPDAVRLKKAYLVRNQSPDDMRDFDTGEPVPSGKGGLVAVRLSIDSSASSKGAAPAADVDGVTRFAFGNIRLFGFNPMDKRAPGISSYPVGVLMPGEEAVDMRALDEGVVMAKKSNDVNLLFNWPAQLKDAPPLALEFKGSGRVQMPTLGVLEEAQRDVSDMFAGYQTALTARMIYTGEGRAAMSCSDMTMVGQTTVNYAVQVGFPGIELVEWAKEQGLLQEDESVPADVGSDGIRRAHWSLSTTKEADNIMQTHVGLYVPPGYVLVGMTVRASDVSRLDTALPRLFDSRSRRDYPPVGVAIRGSSATGASIEVAYSVYKDDTTIYGGGEQVRRAFPKRRLDTSSRSREFTVLYLIAQEKQPIGIMGARQVRQGHQWRFDKGIDVLPIKAL